jgi:hypothetical protein
VPPGFEPERQFGIDWAQPVPAVRAAIAGLPEQDRPEALRQWADAYVAQERAPARARRQRNEEAMARGDTEAAMGGDLSVINDTMRNAMRGTIAGPLMQDLNAGTNALLHRVTGGRAGAPYDESLAYQRATDRALDEEYGRVGAAAQVVGALAGGGAGYNAARRLGLPAISEMGRLARFGTTTGAGAAAAATYGAGTSEGTLGERLAAGAEAAPMGAAIGAVLPPVASAANALLVRPAYNYVSPTIARAGAAIRDIPSRLGIHLSADGGVPVSPGAQAAAEQVIANQAVRSGVDPEQLRNALLPQNRFWSNSYAQDARVLADLDPALQRLASSAGRASPEAGNIAATVMRARQTGITPDLAGEQTIAAAAGIPTREAMTMAGRGDRPAGQFERIRDAFRRSMLIEDQAYHGHLGTGRRTEQQIVDQARAEADQLYDAAYRAGQNLDVPAALAPVFQRWQTILQDQAEPVQKMVTRLLDSMARSRNLQQFDRNKRYLLDARIEQLLNSPVGRNAESARVLTQLKNDLVTAVDTATGGEASPYLAARNAFESQMSSRDALRAGRDAFRDQSEVGVDAFRALGTEGERKLFRLGLLDSYTDAAARMRSGADRLALFDNPRIREILSEVVPSRGSFENPQQLGRWLSGEQRMIATRNEVVGNSKTAQRLADDEAYKAMGMIEESIGVFRNGGVTAGALNLAGRYLHNVFGMRQDTSAAIARMLFTADPAQRRQNLERIIARMGANRAQQLAMYLQQHQAMLTAGAVRGSPGVGP